MGAARVDFGAARWYNKNILAARGRLWPAERARRQEAFFLVSAASIVAMGFTVLVSFVLPLAVPAFLCVRRFISGRVVLTGLSVFSIVQLFIRVPFINWLSTTEWYANISQNLWLLGILLALSAALLENWGRYAGSRFFVRGCNSYRDGLAYGLGHGGVEAFVVMGTNSLSNLTLALAVNNGSIDKLAGDAATAAQVEAVKTALIETPALQFLMGGLERVMVMAVQIALSVVVFYAIRTGRRIWVWAAAGAQFAVNYPVVLLQNSSVWVVEGYLALCAAAAVIVIVKMKGIFDRTPAAAPGEKK